MLCEGTKRDAISVLRDPHPNLETLAAIPFADKEVIAGFIRNRHQIRSQLNSTNRDLHNNVQRRLSKYHYVERQLRDRHDKEQQEQTQNANRKTKKGQQEEEVKRGSISSDGVTTFAKN